MVGHAHLCMTVGLVSFQRSFLPSWVPLLARQAVRSTTEQAARVALERLTWSPPIECVPANLWHREKHCWASQQWHTEAKARRARGSAQAQKSLCGAAIAVETVLVGPDKKCLDRGGRGDALG
jgi:hypothetical protein